MLLGACAQSMGPMAAGDTQLALIATDLTNLQTHCTALVSALGGDGAAAFNAAIRQLNTTWGSHILTKCSRRLLRVLCGGQPYDDKAEEFPR